MYTYILTSSRNDTDHRRSNYQLCTLTAARDTVFLFPRCLVWRVYPPGFSSCSHVKFEKETHTRNPTPLPCPQENPGLKIQTLQFLSILEACLLSGHVILLLGLRRLTLFTVHAWSLIQGSLISKGSLPLPLLLGFESKLSCASQANCAQILPTGNPNLYRLVHPPLPCRCHWGSLTPA